MLPLKDFSPRLRVISALFLTLSLIVGVYSFGSIAQVRLDESEDPFNRINSARIENGKIVEVSSEVLPSQAISFEPFERKAVDEAVPERPAEKIHPLLKARLAEGEDEQMEDVVIAFRDNLKIPRFPQPLVTEPRESATNQRVLTRNVEIIENIKQQRAGQYQEFARSMSGFGDFELRNTFWLIN